MASILSRVYEIISTQGNNLLQKLFFRYPPENFLPALADVPYYENNTLKRTSLSELLNDSILWAVPKKRRSIEKRRTRRFGSPDNYYKMMVPKTNILFCKKCGGYREAGLLCPVCYAKIREETKEMQSAIEKNLGIAPCENEITILYQDDERLDPESYKGKRIVEMKKDRPKLFSENLLQRSTQGLADTKAVVEKK